MPKLPRLRAVRERRALTQDELADLAHVSRATIARLERGRYGTRPPTHRRLARALKVDPELLLGDEQQVG